MSRGVQKYGIERELSALYTDKLEKALKYYYCITGGWKNFKNSKKIVAIPMKVKV